MTALDKKENSNDNSNNTVQKMSVATQLRDNTLERWTLVQAIPDMKEPFEQIIIAIQEGTNTSVVDIYMGPNFYSSLESDEKRFDFLKLLASGLRNLAKLSIGSLGHTKVNFTGEEIGGFVKRARNLAHLRMERHILLDSHEQIQALADGFTNHPSLAVIHMSNLHLTETTTNTTDSDSSAPLNPLFCTMSTLPKLKSLSLRLSTTSLRAWDESKYVLTPSAMTSLAKSPQLDSLDLARLNLHDEHMVAVYQAMPTSQSKLRKLVTSGSPHITAAVWETVLAVLKKSSNSYLEEVISAFAVDPVIRQECQFYFDLNRKGKRRQMRQATDKRMWLELLEQHFGEYVDLATLHVLVRESPCIFSNDNKN